MSTPRSRLLTPAQPRILLAYVLALADFFEPDEETRLDNDPNPFEDAFGA